MTRASNIHVTMATVNHGTVRRPKSSSVEYITLTIRLAAAGSAGVADAAAAAAA